jgi:tellurite resistance protein TerC
MIETVGTPWLWGGFAGLVLVMLAVDLGLFHRKDRAVRTREALAWTGVWIALSLLFGLCLWFRFGRGPAVEFLTGWLVEKSLSVDNLFVFVVVFATFAIPPVLQHRVLFWGILTALVLRAAMIWGGAALIARFAYLEVGLASVLVFIGAKMIAAPWVHVGPVASLAVVSTLLGGAVVLSLLRARRAVALAARAEAP